MSLNRFRRNQPIPVNFPEEPEHTQQSPQPRRPRTGFVISAVLGIIALVASCWGGVSLFTKRDQNGNVVIAPPQIATPVGQNQPQQENQQPGGTVPLGPREDLTICFVTFPSYLPVIMVPTLNNPVYNAVLYPLFFESEDGTVVTLGTEPEQVQMMQDGTCDILFTTSDTLKKIGPDLGRGITIVDKSDGADQIFARRFGITPGCAGKEITIFNDLKGCVIAATGQSVSEFFGNTFTQASAMTTADFTYDTSFEASADASQAGLDGFADAVVCWVPDCGGLEDNPDWFLLGSTADVGTVIDVIVVSNGANATSPAAVDAFLADWFVASNYTATNLPLVADTIANWTYQGHSTNHWTFVTKENVESDLRSGLEIIAQANFNHNQIVADNPNLWYDLLDYQGTVWAWAGYVGADADNSESLVDLSHLKNLANRSDLRATGQFVNNTFSPFPPETSDTLPENLRTIAEFECPNVYFRPGEVTIPHGSSANPNQQYAAFLECANTLRQFMNQADVYIDIEGSGAWPDPAVFGSRYAKCGTGDDDDYCANTAKGRASWAIIEFTNMGFDTGRFTTSWSIGEKTSNQDILSGNRFVKIKIMVGGQG